jgi:uncharacterized protein YjbI with pentapeptide repeats
MCAMISRSLLVGFLMSLLSLSSVDGFVPSSSSHKGLAPLPAKSTSSSDDSAWSPQKIRQAALSAIFTGTVLVSSVSSAWADGQTEKFKFPPIDFSDKDRCVLKGSSMGQANAARDKLYDLRQCPLSGVKAVGYDLSGVIMTGTDLSKANLQESYFSKGFLRDSNFEGADFSNSIVDRASFKGSSLKGAIFQNAVLTGTSFEGANVENADFTEAAIGDFDLRNLCKNPTLKGENPVTGADTRVSVGCK